LNNPAGGPFFLFSSAVRTAEIYTRRRAPRLWMLIKVLIPQKTGKFVFLGYSYLKWADDFADNPEINKDAKKEFIENQLNLLEGLIHKSSVQLKNNEEFFLYHFCKFAEKENPKIILYLKNILESIKLDVERLWEDGIFSGNDLKRYIELQTQASFNLVYYVLLPDSNLEENNYLGKFLWQVRMMKDFQEDMLAGYLNISSEEINFYRLNPKEIMISPNMKEWVMHNYAECMDILKNEMPIIKSLSFKPKIVFASVYQALFAELNRVKEYNFSLNEMDKKKILKELKIYSSSLIMALKFYFKIFF
jgi:hypothetical protein